MIFKRRRINNLKEKIAGYTAEYDELVRITSGLTETNSYYIDKMVGLKKVIAKCAFRLERITP